MAPPRSGTYAREPSDHLSVDLFIQVNAYTAQGSAILKQCTETKDHELFRDTLFTYGGLDESVSGSYSRVVADFRSYYLDTDKMMVHILACASALSRVLRLKRRVLTEANQRTFSYALRHALSGVFEDQLKTYPKNADRSDDYYKEDEFEVQGRKPDNRYEDEYGSLGNESDN